MLLTNNKVRTTKLAKALLTTGLLGGAASSVLSAGLASAAWTTVAPVPPTAPFQSFVCKFIADGCTRDVITPGSVDDKKLTLLDWSGIPDTVATNPSDLEFSYVPGSSTPWHVDLDLNPDAGVTGLNTSGFLAYKIEIDNDPRVFSLVNLISARTSGTTVTKQYGTGWDGTNITGIIDTLNLAGNIGSDQGAAFGKVLYVKDSWSAVNGETIDNISNQFQQVPGPLPLLGAGTAFGFSRRLRSRIKKTRLA